MAKKAMRIKAVKKADIRDADGELRRTGAIKREYDLAKERFMRKPYGKVMQSTMEHIAQR